MKYNKILFNNSARFKILNGINKIAKAVKITLGPKGKNVIIEKKNYPLITKDGVTVAKEIILKDKFENIGAQMIKEIASKMNDIIGDGTTTATIIAQVLINEGLKYIISGINPINLKNGINFIINIIINELEKIAIPCKDYNSIMNVAIISSNSDIKIGTLIANTIKQIGNEGIINIEEGTSFQDEINIVKGMQFDRGYLSPYFINQIENEKTEFENVLILISDNKITNIQEILPILEEISKINKPLLIIAEDYDDEVLTTLVINNMRKIIKIVAVKSPDFGDNRKEILKDISIITNSTIISENTDFNFKNININFLGKAKKIIVTKNNTTIIKGLGNKKEINIRINQIKNQILNTNLEYDKKKLNERLAKLSNGIAIIKVGALTETELKEKKFRIEDALNAVKAAISEGIIPGGGITLMKIAQKLEKKNYNNNYEENIGIKLILKAIQEPFKQLIKNSCEDLSLILNNINSKKNFNFGYDVLNHKYGDMISMGIIDPVKITKYILKLSSSIGCLALTTDCIIIQKNKNKIFKNSNFK